jgi:hypothetical protein
MADFIDLSPALQGVVWKLLGLNEPRWDSPNGQVLRPSAGYQAIAFLQVLRILNGHKTAAARTEPWCANHALHRT